MEQKIKMLFFLVCSLLVVQGLSGQKEEGSCTSEDDECSDTEWVKRLLFILFLFYIDNLACFER